MTRSPRQRTELRARRAIAVRLAMGAAANPSIAALVAAAAGVYGVPPALALAVATQESGLNPNAVSSAGAQGVMQLMPATQAQFGVTNPFDPTQNINAGVKYLAQLLAQFGGDPVAAVAAYNWGPGNVQAAIAQYGAGVWLVYAPAQTQNEVLAVTGVSAAAYATQINQSTYGVTTTIDVTTGDVVDDDTDLSDVAPVNSASVLPAAVTNALDDAWEYLQSNPYLLLTAVAAGVYFVASVLGD